MLEVCFSAHPNIQYRTIFINMQENSYKERILPLTPTNVCFFFFKLLPFASSVYYEIYRDYDQ